MEKIQPQLAEKYKMKQGGFLSQFQGSLEALLGTGESPNPPKKQETLTL